MQELYNELIKISSLLESIKISNELISSGQEQNNEYYSLAYNDIQTHLLSEIHLSLGKIIHKIEHDYLNCSNENNNVL